MTEIIVCYFSMKFLIHTLALLKDHHLNMSNHMTKSIYVAVMKIIMMPSCPYFIFIDASLSKHVDMFFDFGSRLSSSEEPITINMSSCLEVEASIKIKYGHEGIMIISITVTCRDFVIWLLMFKWWYFHKAKSMNQKPYWAPTNYNLSHWSNCNLS